MRHEPPVPPHRGYPEHVHPPHPVACCPPHLHHQNEPTHAEIVERLDRIEKLLERLAER